MRYLQSDTTTVLVIHLSYDNNWYYAVLKLTTLEAVRSFDIIFPILDLSKEDSSKKKNLIN